MKRQYECFMEDHDPKPWDAGPLRWLRRERPLGLHLFRCKRKSGHGADALFCRQHAASGGY